MTDLNQLDEEHDEQLTEADELKLLKERATLMGIKFSNNISVDTLKQKIEEKMSGTAPKEEPTEKANALTGATLVEDGKPVKTKSLRRWLYEEEMKLIRVRITCMDPKKADLHGELLCVSNEYLGNVKRFIPYGEATENGFHIENCLYKTLRDREYIQVREMKGDKSNGMTPRIEKRWVREFAIEVLPPLTAQELHDLKVAQIAAGSIEAAK
ncbi:hypothetical protein [Caballeronia sp. TF1N1]|uniref:hypothetical protein n=1 Tax=Caballeronia sp. TF1N1 TaxID=2878153 RepID=UPI001FD121F1|nr:hypothetical protein [Caballeronia sp. TF1N1]